jgi:hemerythrin-like domain-containing protein
MKALTEEHRHILKAVDALERECNKVSAGKAIDKGFFTGAIDFIRNYADRLHHAKEEDILFTEMCKDTVEMHCNPTEQMLHEHELGRNFVKGMEDGVREGNRKKVADNGLGYARLLREHIYKEDNILYPMANRALGASVLRSIEGKFAKAEKKFPPGTKEKYEKMAAAFDKR